MSASTASRIYIGIDGGGSQTRSLAIDADGRALASGLAGPSNPCNRGVGSAADAIAASIRALALDPAKICAVAAGIAGLATESLASGLRAALLQRAPQLANRPLLLTHDLETAWQGAFGGASGIVLIAGTGSACYAQAANGESRRVSGRADGRDDPGSGYAIGRLGIASGLARAPADASDRAAIAALAPQIFAAAEAGDRAAARMLDAEARVLAEMAAEACELFPNAAPVLAALLGGALEGNAPYRARVAAAIGAHCPRLQIVAPRGSALIGAAELARKTEKKDS